MKVFISWSGDRSNKIAEIMKKWIKHVIQSVEPFVSSQDLPTGTRWSSDIAKELQDTNFGILCVTKDNYKEPWLLFEAGALSKTIDKSYVVPLLFDLEPSDLQESPLLQFQAASFNKEEIKKLVHTLNEAGNSVPLDIYDLDEAFEVWYPKLEKDLSEIPDINDEAELNEENPNIKKNEQIMEEILDLTRINQKLLRNPETDLSKYLSDINAKLDKLTISREYVESARRKRSKLSSMFIKEFIHAVPDNIDATSKLLVLLSLCKESFPWIFESGKNLIEILKSEKSIEEKELSLHRFEELIEYTDRYIIRLDSMDYSKEDYIILREILMYIDRTMNSYLYDNSK